MLTSFRELIFIENQHDLVVAVVDCLLCLCLHASDSVSTVNPEDFGLHTEINTSLAL